MFGNWKQEPADATAQGLNGMEMTAKAFGMGKVIEAANQLAQSGAVQKIMKFADALEGMEIAELNRRLERIERALGIEPQSLGKERASQSDIGNAEAEPGSGATDRRIAS
jgi:hypothetical protein